VLVYVLVNATLRTWLDLSLGTVSDFEAKQRALIDEVGKAFARYLQGEGPYADRRDEWREKRRREHFDMTIQRLGKGKNREALWEAVERHSQ